MDLLPLRENTDFPIAIKNALLSENTQDTYLLYHQILPMKYFTMYPKARGILMMHETGTGKSINAVAIADEFKKQGRRAIIMLPKTLQNNFKDNIIKYKMGKKYVSTEKEARQQIDKEYKFVSTNASNMMKQLAESVHTGDSDIRDIIDDEIGKNENYEQTPSLEGTVVIVDEAHNLFNGIISGSKNARGLYSAIISAVDVKIVFLTSTVIMNSPFEIVPCFNMISGSNLLPVDYNDFMEMFVDEKTKNLKNAEHLKARIFGLTSYYGSIYNTGGIMNIHKSVHREGMPVRLPIKEVIVTMSESQYEAYMEARASELSQRSYTSVNTYALSKPTSDSGSTYSIHSRQIENFWIEQVGLIDNAFVNLEKYSPKFMAVLENIHKHKAGLGIVYSTFVKTYGINWFSKMLDHDGYSKFITGNEPIEGKKRYAFITGEMDPDDRANVIYAFNSDQNKDGSLIHLLLGSPAMKEGIDTKRVRHVHILEAQWHYSTIEQIIARAVRHGSHIDLPKDERNVQAYVYLSDHNDNATVFNNTEPTTDIIMYYKSIKNKITNDAFKKAIIEASIDCSIHIESASAIAKSEIKCMMCVPDNKQLFDKDYTAHLRKPLTCRPVQTKSVEVEEIEYGGKKFYYSKDVNNLISIYQYDIKTSNYRPLTPMSKWYDPILLQLSKK
jgi:superfamily II DNA or RNA helicase